MSDPNASVDKAKDIKTLSDAAWLLFQTSMAKYHQISLDHWQMVTGEAEPDTDKFTKNAIAFYANAARDMGNLMMVMQKASNLGVNLDLMKLQGATVVNPATGGTTPSTGPATPPPPPAPGDGGG